MPDGASPSSSPPPSDRRGPSVFDRIRLAVKSQPELQALAQRLVAEPDLEPAAELVIDYPVLQAIMDVLTSPSGDPKADMARILDALVDGENMLPGQLGRQLESLDGPALQLLLGVLHTSAAERGHRRGRVNRWMDRMQAAGRGSFLRRAAGKERAEQILNTMRNRE